MPQNNSDSSTAVAAPQALDAEIAAFVGTNSFPSFDDADGSSNNSNNSNNSNLPANMQVNEEREERNDNDPDNSNSNNRIAEHEASKSRKEVKLDPKVAKQLGIPISGDAEVEGNNTNKVKKDEKDSKGKLANGEEDLDKAEEIDEEDQEQETTQSRKEGERNLEGFGEQEKIWLRRMPRAAFDHFAKRLRDVSNIEGSFKAKEKALEEKIKTLETGRQILPESYYENPEAVVLTKEFRDAQSGLSLVGQYKNHWEQQLLAIEKGEKWFDLVEDPKTGQVMIDPTPKEPDAVNKINVSKWLMSMSQQEIQLQQKLGGIVEGFKSRHSEISNKIKEAEDKFMPAYSDEKSEDYKIVKDIQGELGKLGVSQYNPVNRMLAKSIALNITLKNYILSSLQKKGIKEGIEKDQRRAGPTDGNFTGSEKGGSRRVAPTTKDFAALGLPKI